MRYVAFLRGVNVGGRGTVRMDALRDLFAGLGFDDVTTYIQSGNVVFSAGKAPATSTIETALVEQLRVAATVVVRSATQLTRVIDRDPFPDAPRAAIHIGFLPKAPSASLRKRIDFDRYAPETAACTGTEVYFHLPNGMGRAKLPAFAERQLEMPMTVRNWNTVTKLRDLAQG